MFSIRFVFFFRVFDLQTLQLLLLFLARLISVSLTRSRARTFAGGKLLLLSVRSCVWSVLQKSPLSRNIP